MDNLPIKETVMTRILWALLALCVLCTWIAVHTTYTSTQCRELAYRNSSWIQVECDHEDHVLTREDDWWVCRCPSGETDGSE